MSEDRLLAVHDYWCGQLRHQADFPEAKAALWFERRDETDDFIRSTFGADLDRIAAEELDINALAPQAAIGLVILLDQFPRNLFRNDARAYAYDPLARRHARRAVEHGVARFALVERVFLYLPFEHSEVLEDQDLSVRLYEALLAEAPPEQAGIYRNYLDFAVKHRDLIARFGRFPHRNADLGRSSTSEETAFLEANGRGY